MHPLYGAQRVPCASADSTDDVVAHQYTYVPPHCRTIIPLSVFLWNDLADPVFDGVGLAGFKSMANA